VAKSWRSLLLVSVPRSLDASFGFAMDRAEDRAIDRGMRRFWLWGLAAQGFFVVAMSILAYTGALSASFLAIPHVDKVCHFFSIGLVAFFLDGALGHRPLFAWRRSRDEAAARGEPRLRARASALRLGPALVVVAAGAEEFAQRFSRYRGSSWLDFAADLAGVAFFSWLAKRVTRALDARERALPARAA
jgi:hypothetical protein